MNILTLDIGNTVSKVIVWDNTEVLWHDVCTEPDSDYFIDLKKKFNVEGASVCSTGKHAEEYLSILERVFDYNVNLLSKQSANDYNVIESYKGQLGPDRLAAYIGVLTSYPGTPCMVVDCGTAITIDIIDDEGKFCGGNISAGLELRLKALHNYTSLLPEVSIKGIVSDFGNNTESAMRDGVINGVIGEIIYSYMKAKNKYGIDKIVFTGGDATLLLIYLEKEKLNVCYDPYLVGRGLKADFLKNHCCRRKAI